MTPGHLPASPPPRTDDPGLDLPLPTRIALWVLLGVSLLILLILVQYQRQQAQLVVAQRSVLSAQQFATAPHPAVPAAPAEPANNPPLPQATLFTPREELDPARWTVEMATAELAILRDIHTAGGSGDPRRTLKRLTPLLSHQNETVRADAAALEILLDGELAAALRQQARTAAEAAEDLADAGDFDAAYARLEAALSALPDDATEARANAGKALEELRVSLRKRQQDARETLLGAPNAPNAVAKARELLTHTDALIRAEAERRVRAHEQAQTALQMAARARQEDARNAWLRVFAEYRTAILDGNLAQAEQLITSAAKNSALESLAFDKATVLRDMNAEIAGMKTLQAAVLALPADKRNLDLPLRRNRVTGQFIGARGRQLSILLDGGAVVSVKVESLAAGAFSELLGAKRLDELKLRPFVWALSAHENPAGAPAFMARNYTQASQPLPEYWRLQFSLEAFRFAESSVAQKLEELQAALKLSDAEKTRRTMEELQPALASLREFGPIAPEREALVKQAEKLVGRLQNQTVTLQTGIAPDEKYKGLQTDQISQYLDSQGKTDVGVQFGLKVGAAGGLQRVLLKFDGLEAAIAGKGRVKKATLHLYQIESPRSLGASVGLFRIKRSWSPDSGTWRNYNSAKDATGKTGDWAVPGAAGEDDITNSEDASVTLDAKKGLWRTFDLTRYVQDVLQGRWQNNGLLMRVTNGEADFHVRFYPETDLDGAQKDLKLRPKLILDLEGEL